jgi:hypothetical protein
MQELDPNKPLRHAMHVDVSVAREHAEARVAAALAEGGRLVHEADAPEGWILADSAGNRVCIAAWPDGGFTDTHRAAVSTTTGDSRPERTHLAAIRALFEVSLFAVIGRGGRSRGVLHRSR